MIHLNIDNNRDKEYADLSIHKDREERSVGKLSSCICMWMDNEMFDYKKIDRDDISILYLRGDLNALSADQLRKVINDVILSKHLKVIVEVSSLELIDSSGLGALVSLFKRMRSVCGHLKIVGLQGQPLELFQLLDLHKVFDLVNNIEDAMEQFQGKYNREESAIHLTEQSVSWPK